MSEVTISLHEHCRRLGKEPLKRWVFKRSPKKVGLNDGADVTFCGSVTQPGSGERPEKPGRRVILKMFKLPLLSIELRGWPFYGGDLWPNRDINQNESWHGCWSESIYRNVGVRI